MGNILGVQGLQGLQGLREPSEDFLRRRGSRRFEQALPFDVFHPEARPSVFAEKNIAVGLVAVDPRDCGMAEFDEKLGLLGEELDLLTLHLSEELQGHGLALRSLGQEDLAHAAFPEWPQNFR